VTLKIQYQLWCYYETADEWKMEGFFNDAEEARAALQDLRGREETPCMDDWEIVRVEVCLP
jgi:hypothetical protein